MEAVRVTVTCCEKTKAYFGDLLSFEFLAVSVSKKGALLLLLLFVAE